jgi:hypothetical protein
LLEFVPADLHAVHVGQHQVEDDEFEASLVEALDGGPPVGRPADVVAGGLQVQTDQAGDVVVVLDDQDVAERDHDRLIVCGRAARIGTV